ncbi:30S ribosomal protein S17 [candidate division KSB1 bacterium]|nr:30S ribosomal protein S17 [candidate division KSB1 bacterium]
MENIEREQIKSKQGHVSSDKMDKSRVIVVERLIKHPIYKKVIKKTSKIMVHDEKNESHVGDLVKVVATRPLSKRKHWRVLEILERAK